MVDWTPKPRWVLTDETLRAMILDSAKACFAARVYPSPPALRRHGCRGSHHRIAQVRDAMLDTGDLIIPPELIRPDGRKRRGKPKAPVLMTRRQRPMDEASRIARVLARRGGVP